MAATECLLKISDMNQVIAKFLSKKLLISLHHLLLLSSFPSNYKHGVAEGFLPDLCSVLLG